MIISWQWVVFILIVLIGSYLLIVKLAAKLTPTKESELLKLLLAAIAVIAVMMVFIELFLN